MATTRRVLDLALQGGGAHGAFTWGVLDRLLEAPDMDIGRISGTSAGALNAAALVTGYVRGGREGARRQLALLWQKVAEAGFPLTFLLLPLRKPGMGIWDDALPLLSPYQAHPRPPSRSSAHARRVRPAASSRCDRGRRRQAACRPAPTTARASRRRPASAPAPAARR